MKISRLIEVLSLIRKNCGDLEVIPDAKHTPFEVIQDSSGKPKLFIRPSWYDQTEVKK